MSYKIIVEPEAQLDIDENFQYYKNIAGRSIAKKFAKSVTDSYKTIKKNPFYQIRTKNYRAYPLKNFPFLLFYEVFEEEELIKILAVFKTEQDPQKYPS